MCLADVISGGGDIFIWRAIDTGFMSSSLSFTPDDSGLRVLTNYLLYVLLTDTSFWDVIMIYNSGRDMST